jgi:type II secretory pathway component PulC
MQHIDFYLQKYKADARVPRLVTAVIVLCFIISAYSIMGYFRLSAGTPISLPIIKAVQSTPIAGMHLFGYYASDYNDLPETQLQLTLQGTEVNLTDTDLSLAIIASSGQKTKTYYIGNSIPGGATIHAIQQTRVIINDNGELERLSMKIPKLTEAPVTQGIPMNSGLSAP